MSHRAAERPAKLVLPESRPGQVEIATSIQVCIAQEFERIAVEGIASGFGDDSYYAAVIVTVFWSKIICEHLEFIDGVEIRHNGCPAIHVLLHINSVHQKTVRRFSLSVNRQIAWI